MATGGIYGNLKFPTYLMVKRATILTGSTHLLADLVTGSLVDKAIPWSQIDSISLIVSATNNLTLEDRRVGDGGIKLPCNNETSQTSGEGVSYFTVHCPNGVVPGNLQINNSGSVHGTLFLSIAGS